MGLWGTNQGNSASAERRKADLQEQKQLFAQAAQDSGMAAMGMGMLDQMTGGSKMSNENQVQMIYQLMATHPNEVVLFFLHYPDFNSIFGFDSSCDRNSTPSLHLMSRLLST